MRVRLRVRVRVRVRVPLPLGRKIAEEQAEERMPEQAQQVQPVSVVVEVVVALDD